MESSNTSRPRDITVAVLSSEPLWQGSTVPGLFVLNFLTIVIEFIGVALALAYFSVSKYVAVPIAAAILIAITSPRRSRSPARARPS
jgi:hypothetical protein